MLILCVEDENFLRNDIVEELVIGGYEVVEASNGEEALSKMERRLPHLVLTDVSMPQMNGYQLLDRVKNTSGGTSNIPVIFMTAFDEKDVSLKCNAKPDAFIRKPIDYTELLELVRRFTPCAVA